MPDGGRADARKIASIQMDRGEGCFPARRDGPSFTRLSPRSRSLFPRAQGWSGSRCAAWPPTPVVSPRAGMVPPDIGPGHVRPRCFPARRDGPSVTMGPHGEGRLFPCAQGWSRLAGAAGHPSVVVSLRAGMVRMARAKLTSWQGFFPARRDGPFVLTAAKNARQVVPPRAGMDLSGPSRVNNPVRAGVSHDYVVDRSVQRAGDDLLSGAQRWHGGTKMACTP